MEKVEVDVESLRIILDFLDGSERHSKAVLTGAKYQLMSVFKDIPLRIELSDYRTIEGMRVKPKPGRNYLRAGQTAYDEAMVIKDNPFTIISLDGKSVWKGLEKNLFLGFPPLDANVIDELVTAYERIENE